LGELAYKYDNPAKQDLSQYTLRLTCICDVDEFSFAVENIDKGELVCVRTYDFDRKYHLFDEPLGFLGEIMREERVLYNDYHSKTLFVRGVPFRVFEGHLPEAQLDPVLLDDVSTTGPNDVVMCDRLHDEDMSLVFAIPGYFRDEVALYFSKADIRHAMSGLICASGRENATGSHLTARISRHFLEVAVRDHNGLLFANHFQCTDHADILYFLAAVINELDSGINKYVLGGSHFDDRLLARHPAGPPGRIDPGSILLPKIPVQAPGPDPGRPDPAGRGRGPRQERCLPGPRQRRPLLRPDVDTLTS